MMSSCSQPTMKTISCCDPVKNPADEPVSNCYEGIDEVPVSQEAASHDSSNKSPNMKEPVETTQNVRSVEREEMSIGELGSIHSADFRHLISVKRRTAIITRLDGVNLSTGSEVSFYKCHLCGKLFGRLADVPMHMSLHSPQQMTLYQCLLCDGSFSFKTKLMRHLRVRHNVNLPRRVENLAADGFSVSSKDLSNVTDGSNCGRKNIPQGNDEFIQSSVDSALRASTKSPTELEVDTSMSCEESGGLQLELRNHSVENSDRISEDEVTLEKPSLDKVANGLFRSDPVKGLTKMNSFLCQLCGFESWRQSHLLHHVIKHHVDLAAVQKMRKQLLRRRKLQLPQRTSEQRMFCNGRELKIASSATSSCVMSSDAECRTISSETPNVECKEEPSLSLSLSPKTANHPSERSCLYDDDALAARSVLHNPTDIQDSPKTNYSDMSESFHMADQIKNEKLLASEMTTEQLIAMDSKSVNAGSSLTSMHPSSSICDITTLQPDATITTSSPATTMSSMIASHENESERKPLIFSPNNISPLIHGFLPLPLLSLLVSQSNLNPASFRGTSNSNSSQFASDQVNVKQQSFNEQFSVPRATNSLDESDEFEESKAEDVKPSRAMVDWRAMMRNRTKGLASRGSSTFLKETLNAKFNAGNDQGEDIETLKPIITSDGQAVYHCTYCNKDFSTALDVTRHMEFHEDIRPYRCTHCDYHARTNSQLKVHMMRHQGIRKFQCRLCNYKGVTQSDLNRHAKSQIHMLKARNQCESCGEGFVSPINLGKHFHERHFGQKANPDLDHRQ